MKHESITQGEQEMALSLLERDQLAGRKKIRLPRRKLKGAEKFLIWFLRIYLLFMMAVVVYQVWSAGR